ncbi:BZ3500_MvSof-1268-A1-R1_Chr1-3g02494 [Microbotryum saponariae]|uniref:Protein AF-9 homolog n=1 Tax=Microbotryum saponariae TaxID=289078 RepID=A0A2X0MVZ5_9BASI|nr:BZ3500_MvSof-1268-A1-R1_Chr1-3g02494 [Microbotryum saponariae]SCZ96395.1 BZ3501_MvSof-1269-A2-R1_Chr1-3g02097 [Microbotryum saponariae]
MSHKRLRGVSVYRPLIYGNTAVLLEPHERVDTDHTHRWTVAVRSANSPTTPSKDPASQVGNGDDIGYFVKKVTFKLHETYAQPLRTLERPPFQVTETGWGEFDIIIKIFFVNEAAEKPISFTHHLKLHPWPIEPLLLKQPAQIAIAAPTTTTTMTTTTTTTTTTGVGGVTNTPATTEGTAVLSLEQVTTDLIEASEQIKVDPPSLVLSPVHSWQYEQVVFVEPTEAFYSLLLANPQTALPKTNRHPKLLVHQLGGGGHFGEFTLDMEREEGDRLDEARRKTMVEIDALRKRLVGGEKELLAIKQQVEQLSAPGLTA